MPKSVVMCNYFSVAFNPSITLASDTFLLVEFRMHLCLHE